MHLCLLRLETGNVTADDIKKALEIRQRDKNTVEANEEAFPEEKGIEEAKGQDDGVNLLETNEHFVELHNLFLEVCELYVDIVVDKDGRHSRLDRLSRQQLYFLTVEPDDFHQLVFSKSSRSEQDEDEEDEKAFSLATTAAAGEGDDKVKRNATDTTAPSVTSEGQKRPFQFSDFASAQPSERPDSPNVSEDSDMRGTDEKVSSGGECERTKIVDSPTVSRGASLSADDRQVVPPLVEGDEEVFRVTTQTEMDSMMSEYRHRKGQRTMPSSSGGSLDTPPSTASGSSSRRKNPFLFRPSQSGSVSSAIADPEISSQHNASMMADSQARSAVWTELVLAVLDLAGAAPDKHFRPMLPVLFPGVRALTAYARDEALKQRVADFFQRVASIYGFNPDLQQ